MSDESKNAFEQAGKEKEGSLPAEFLLMLRQNKKYWLMPLVVILLLFGLVVILGSTGAAPFIYALF